MNVFDLLSEYQEVYFVKMVQSRGGFSKFVLEGKKGCPKILPANLGMRGFRAKLVSFTISLDPFRAFWCRVELQMTYSFSASEMCLQNGIKPFHGHHFHFHFFTDQRRSFRGTSFVSANAAWSKDPNTCNIHIRRLPPPEKSPNPPNLGSKQAIHCCSQL
jgi:hypothetical protein